MASAIVNKLYPPILSKIPAFYGDILTVPFAMNRAVRTKEITGFDLIVKTLSTNKTLIAALPAISFELDTKMEAYFNISDLNLFPGEFYKIQMAYHSVIGTGYYSTVATVKYTSKPTLTIAGLEKYIPNMHMYHYTGEYAQEERLGRVTDTTEKVYTYRFDVYDNNNKVICSSGDVLHNGMNDTEINSSNDYFEVPQELEKDRPYWIQYSVCTLNGMIASSYKYRIMSRNSVDPEMKADFIATNYFDNGYIKLNMKGKTTSEGIEIPATGTFLITRANSKDNYNTWNNIFRFSLQGQKPSKWTWKDLTVEQGITYRYSIQQYNESGLYSNRILSNDIKADFEDAFLYDGNLQLKIKFNPKVTNFKVNVSETKSNTLGAQYPFIFRNGNTYYREFAISGMLSYWSDEENFFIDKDELQIEVPETDLTSDNIYAERVFKLKALEWLSDGKPKIFRSPGEGNFIVRLMNVTLTPSDPVGRMLHTFNCTAYEIADYNYNNLESYNFINVILPDMTQMRWETIELHKLKVSYAEEQLLNDHPAITLEFTDMNPGDQVLIDGILITIGATGGYILHNVTSPIKEIRMPKGAYSKGSLTYGYYSTKQNLFDTIVDFQIDDIPVQQFIGQHNITNEENDIRISLQRFYSMSFEIRPTHILYYRSLSQPYQFYFDYGCTQLLETDDYDPFVVYALYHANLQRGDKIKLKDNAINLSTGKPFIQPILDENKWQVFAASSTTVAFMSEENLNMVIGQVRVADIDFEYQSPQCYYDFYNNKIIAAADYSASFTIDGSTVDLTEIKQYKLKDPGMLTSVTQSDGVISNIAMQKRIITYSVEEKIPEVKNAKQAYVDSENNLKYILFGYPYNIDGIAIHWKDTFKPQTEHWSGVGLGYDNDPDQGFNAALIWTNLDEHLYETWYTLGAAFSYAESPYIPPFHTWNEMEIPGLMIVLDEETELPDLTDSLQYLDKRIVDISINFTYEEYMYNPTIVPPPRNLDPDYNNGEHYVEAPVAIAAFAPEETIQDDGSIIAPSLADSRWIEARIPIGGEENPEEEVGSSPIGVWIDHSNSELENLSRIAIDKVVGGITITDYKEVVKAQREEVQALYSNYINLLAAALEEDEEARRQ